MVKVTKIKLGRRVIYIGSTLHRRYKDFEKAKNEADEIRRSYHYDK